jgi:hypothetical protein
MPDATTPQQKAHMGGNQVMGLSNSATTASEGTVGAAEMALVDMRVILGLTQISVNLNLHQRGLSKSRRDRNAVFAERPYR